MNASIQDDNYSYFLLEAEDLLKTIESELLSLHSDRTVAKIHNLMRASHTLKGAATSVGLDTMKDIAHVLEDVFKSLYNPDVEIDAELESLLFQGYECLRLCLQDSQPASSDQDQTTASISQHTEDILNRVATIISQLQTKLGDFFNQEAAIPSSAELGFDVTQSIFEMGVKQRLDKIAAILKASDSPDAIKTELKTHAEVFLGLSESLNLPGWGAIATATLAALDKNPHYLNRIARVALADFKKGHAAVLKGDRTQGGTPSPALKKLAIAVKPQVTPLTNLVEPPTNQESAQTESLPLPFPGLELSSASNQVPALDLTPSETQPLEAFPGLEAPSEPDEIPETDLETLFSEAQSAPPVPLSPSTDVAWLADDEDEEDFTDGAASPSPVQSETAAPAPASPPTSFAPSSTVRVEVEQLERLNYLSGELLINQNKQIADVDQLNSTIQKLSRHLQQHQHTIHALQGWSDRLRLMHTESQVLSTSVFNKSIAPVLNGNTLHSGFSAQSSALSTLLPFDSLEMDSYSDVDVLLQSALEETAQLESVTEQLELLARQAKHSLDKQQRFMTNVRDDLTAARMQPLSNVFNRLLPVLNQLIATRHKPVQLTITGAQVPVDKAIAEKLYDPLLHLLRNAFDHGIESPELRKTADKSETGHITIRAYRQGSRTLIEVQDDGRGLDFERIRQRAVELNLLNAEQAATLPNARLTDLLFEPGFTTTSKLSDLSGRGIGLDSVRTQLQAIGGTVTVKSRPLQGTTFCLQIPLTLTITKLMLCRSGGMIYALVSDAIEQILIPKSDEIHSLNGQRVLRYMKENIEFSVPLQTLADLLSYSPQRAIAGSESFSADLHTTGFPVAIATQASTSFSHPVFLINSTTGFFGLEVDQIIGEQELVVRPLGSAVTAPQYVCGSSVLNNRQMALVIDVGVLAVESIERKTLNGAIPATPSLKDTQTLVPLEVAIDRVTQSPSTHSTLVLDAQSPTETQHPQKQHTSARTPLAFLPASILKVMIVDDSVTIRQTLTKVLRKAGYQVLQAIDGLDALEQLQQHPKSCFSIICDIEMPRMNGFELLNQCRQDAALSHIPIVILTSRTSAKHRQIAEELGASVYMTKPYSERELLAHLANLLNQRVAAQPE